MTSRKKSLRAQVVNWLMVLFGILLLISIAVSYVAAVDFANLPYDHQLLATARTLGSHVRDSRNGPSLDLADAIRDSLLYDEDDRTIFRITTSTGQMVGGDAPLPSLSDEEAQSQPELITTEIAGVAMRIGTIQLRVPNASGDALPLTVQIAETLNKRSRLARKIFFKLLIPQIILAALPIGGLWLGVGSGLAPLERLKVALTARSQYDLSPVSVDEDTPDEVRPLIDAFNEILERMRNLLDSQQRFVADAAHQLRTPLAGLKTQAEFALRLDNPREIRDALRQVLAGAERGSSLASQLLTLARHERSQHDEAPFQRVDLNAIVREAATQYVDAAMAKGVDLGFEAHATPLIVSGDPVGLREMAGNLIDNAVRYTQSGGRVTASVSAHGGLATVRVEDNGPGIPHGDRERVFERFYRGLGTNQEGSGLGLAIVREIAQLHGATATIDDGPGSIGTVFRVDIPTAPTASDPAKRVLHTSGELQETGARATGS